MRGLLQTMLSAGLMVAVAVSAMEADGAQKEKGKKRAGGQNHPAFAIPKEITLTADQQAKLDAIKKENGPKLAELTQRLDAGITDEQKAARKAAMAQAKADGKKGKAAQEAVNAALNLTDEQKKKRAEIQPEMAKLQASIKEQIHGILTDDQKTHYKLPKAKKAKKAK